jgi:hypothetical protein
LLSCGKVYLSKIILDKLLSPLKPINSVDLNKFLRGLRGVNPDEFLMLCG